MVNRASLVLALIAVAGTAAPAQATQPGRNGALAMSFDDNEDNGSSTGSHPYPIRHGYLAVGSDWTVRPVAWCAHRWGEPSPCERFGEIDFSPDGALLADATPGGLRVRRPDGQIVRTVSDLYATSPSWSPDGRRIAFVSIGDVYTVGADGTGLRRVTRTESGDDAGGKVGSVSWSSRGRLAIALSRGRGTGIVTATPTGRRARLILRAPRSDPRGTVDWAPDGRRILVSAGGRILMADSRRRSRARVVRREGRGARISPDGRWIAYFVNDPDVRDVVAVARPDGRGRRLVGLIDAETGHSTREYFRDYGPLTWQPLP